MTVHATKPALETYPVDVDFSPLGATNVTVQQIDNTWPDNTRLFRLESSSTLPGGFTAVPAEPGFINNQNQVTLPRDPIASRFFRLTSGPD